MQVEIQGGMEFYSRFLIYYLLLAFLIHIHKKRERIVKKVMSFILVGVFVLAFAFCYGNSVVEAKKAVPMIMKS